MKRFTCSTIVMVAAMALPMSSAWAVGENGNAAGWLGGFSFPNYVEGGQMCYGLIHDSAKAGAPGAGQFGLWWDGPVEVTELSFELLATRNTLGTVYLYTSPNAAPITIHLGGKHSGTIDLTQFNNGLPIQAVNSYILLACPQNGGSFGAISLSFDAKPIDNADVNVNYNHVSFGTTVTNVTGNSQGTFGVVIDGTLESMSTLNTLYFNMVSQGSLTVSYGLDEAENNILRTIDSVGLSFAGDSQLRNCPKWVLIGSADVDAEPVRIDIDPNQTLYGQYSLPEGMFVDINSLTITMPPPPGADAGANAQNWWDNGGVDYGITQFQAFGPPVPEPATMTLLALGGLAMLRRRGRAL